jgi:hypothetical protein
MKKSALTLTLILCGCQSEDAQLSPDDHACRPHRFPILEAYCGGASEAGGPCKGVPKAFAEACADGCVLQTCGPAVACKENAAICEGSCADPKSALFWREWLKAEMACQPQDRLTAPPPRPCVVKETEKRCPELAGTRWSERIPEIQKW